MVHLPAKNGNTLSLLPIFQSKGQMGHKGQSYLLYTLFFVAPSMHQKQKLKTLIAFPL